MRLNAQVIGAIARKYARAYINVYLDTLTDESYRTIKQLELFLKRNKKVSFFLEIPSIAPKEKKNFIDQIASEFRVPSTIKKLYDLLLQDDRPMIMPDVLAIIRELYQEQKNVMEFSIITSHSITEKNIHTIVQFLAHKLNCAIIYEYTVDPTLIAGMRLQSNTVLWEHSVSKQLQQIRFSV